MAEEEKHDVHTVSKTLSKVLRARCRRQCCTTYETHCLCRLIRACAERESEKVASGQCGAACKLLRPQHCWRIAEHLMLQCDVSSLRMQMLTRTLETARSKLDGPFYSFPDASRAFLAAWIVSPHHVQQRPAAYIKTIAPRVFHTTPSIRNLLLTILPCCLFSSPLSTTSQDGKASSCHRYRSRHHVLVRWCLAK